MFVDGDRIRLFCQVRIVSANSGMCSGQHSRNRQHPGARFWRRELEAFLEVLSDVVWSSGEKCSSFQQQFNYYVESSDQRQTVRIVFLSEPFLDFWKSRKEKDDM